MALKDSKEWRRGRKKGSLKRVAGDPTQPEKEREGTKKIRTFQEKKKPETLLQGTSFPFFSQKTEDPP